jgi:hypothetical protein
MSGLELCTVAGEFAVGARGNFEVERPEFTGSLSVGDGRGELDAVVKSLAAVCLLGRIIFEVVGRVLRLEEAAVLVFLWWDGHGLVGKFTKADRPLGVEVVV